jgi:hypothetical protein
MTSNFSLRRLVLMPAAASLSLLAALLLPPSTARAGCAHLVTSRTDPLAFSSLVDPLILAGGGHSEPLPAAPVPCSGAWCSEQPAVPAVPAGALDLPGDSWVWCASPVAPNSIPAAFLAVETSKLRALRRNSAVFHPPRPLGSA